MFGLPGVVVTPHLGASTAEAQDKAGTDIAEQVAGREDRRGWGIHLMQNLVDQVSFHVNEQGEHFTCLYLFKNDVGNVRQGEDR